MEIDNPTLISSGRARCDQQLSEHSAGIDGDQRVALLTGPAMPSPLNERADHLHGVEAVDDVGFLAMLGR